MKGKILAPGMQNGCNPKSCAKKLLVRSEILQCFRDSLKEQRIENSLVLIYDGAQVVRHSKDHMEISHIEQIVFLTVDPALFSECLTLGAVPVSAGIVRDIDATATFAGIHVSAEFSGAALLDSEHSFLLSYGQTM